MRRASLIRFAALACLAIALACLARWDELTTEQERTSQLLVPDFNAELAFGLTYQAAPDSTPLRLNRQASGEWQQSPEAAERPVDQRKIIACLYLLASYRFERQLRSQGSSWPQYELNATKKRLTVSYRPQADAPAREVILLFGSKTPIGAGVYLARQPDDGSVYIGSDSLSRACQQNFEPPPLAATTPEN